jgi:hypothetical protein
MPATLLPEVSRRTLLGVGSLALLGLSRATAAPRATAKGRSLVLLYMTGGPAQQETFDPKPDAPEGTRGEFKPTATSVPGVQICEHLPLLAK